MIGINGENEHTRFGRFLITSVAILIVIAFFTSGIPMRGINEAPQDNLARVKSGDSSINDYHTAAYDENLLHGTRVESFGALKDTTICGFTGATPPDTNSNIGTDPDLIIPLDSSSDWKQFRVLIQFDISAIPPNSEISSASIKITYYLCYNGIDGGTGAPIEGGVNDPLTITAKPLTHSWTEGTGSMSSISSDGATWNTYDGSNSWSQAGGDYAATPTGTGATPNSGYGITTISVTDIVQAWVNGDITNNGVILYGSAGSDAIKFFRSREYATPEQRPVLEADYVTNFKPVAIIDLIDPSPARELVDITFTGHGTDEEDTNATSGYIWSAQKTGGPAIVLGTQASITADNLTHGTYTVGFRVKDSEGSWSDMATQELIVNPDEPPAEIDDLEAEPHGGLDGAINLTWTAVAEDGDSQQGKADFYIIKYSDGDITSLASFENAKEVPNKNEIPDPGNPGSDESFTVTGLTSGMEYFFAMVAQDEAEQQGVMSDVVKAFAPDHNSPGAIDDLNAIPGEEDGEVELEWTAPGDDGADSGRTISYIVKCSREEIEDVADLVNAFDMPNKEDIPNPEFATIKETLMVTGLESGKTHNFTVMAVDESGNVGPLSNTATSIAKDLTPPPALTGLTAIDTPDDGGKSITVTWIPTKVDDFDHYAIFVSRTTISDIDSTIPDKIVDVRSTSSTTVTKVGGASLSDWTKYYVVVVAVDVHDNYDEKLIEQSCCGPVITINNLERPQPLIDPEAGTTQTDLELIPYEGVEVEITKVNVSLLVSELDDRNARLNYKYDVELTASVPGDEIDHIDLYFGVKGKSSNMEWLPLMDLDNLDSLFPEDPRYWDDYYGLFIPLVQDGDHWSIVHEYTVKVKKEEVPGGMSNIGELGREYKISAIAWTKTYKWNGDEKPYDLDKETNWKLDQDDDGLKDGWEEQYFDNIEFTGKGDDPDGDGFSNLKEYEMGTDPNDRESHPSGKPDIKLAGEDDGGIPMWVIIVIIVFVVLGFLLIAVIMVLKKKKNRDVPAGPPIAPQPVQQPAWPQQQQRGPRGPPGRGPPGPPAAPSAAYHPPPRPRRKKQEFPEHVKQLYQKVQQRAAEIQSELPQAKDPQQRQALIDEYQQLQEQVKELQAQMQGQSPAQEQLPAGPSAQKALPPGPSAQKAEIEEADAAIEKAMNEVEAEASLEQDGASDIKPVLIECHVCSATNVVSTSDRPTVVVCSSCGEQGYLTE